MTNEEIIALIQYDICLGCDYEYDVSNYECKRCHFGAAIAALKAEPCDTLKLDGMLEDAYEHGYQQARYDYEVQPCEDAVSREAVIAVLDWHEHEKSEIESYIREIAEDIKALPPVTPKQKWIPLTWDESECNSSFPDDMDGSWAIFTDGKLMSIERGKKDAFDHFFPSGRWFEMSDAIAWMPLPTKYEKGESE